jgi:glucokinase
VNRPADRPRKGESTADQLVVGVDIGGTSVEAIVTDPADRILSRALHPTDATSEATVLASAVVAIGRALDDVDGAPIHGIGVGIPGQVDVEAGVARLAMNLNISDGGFAVGPGIEEAFGVRTTVENDVRAAAVGAYDYQRERVPNVRTLAYLGIGTGISAGFVVDGHLHRGREGMAGEIGHVVVAENGPLCRCGARGCLEAVAAGPAIARMWPSGGGQPAQDLFGAAEEGNPAAIGVAARVTAHVAGAVQWLAAAYGADLVVLGGGVGSIGEPLLSAVRTRLGTLAGRSDLARRLVSAERIVAMPPGFPTGAVGAAALARRRQSGDGSTSGTSGRKEEGAS